MGNGQAEDTTMAAAAVAKAEMSKQDVRRDCMFFPHAGGGGGSVFPNARSLGVVEDVFFQSCQKS